MDLISFLINIIIVIYVSIPLLIGLVVFIQWLIGKSAIGEEKFEKILEVAKWYLISVAVVLAGKIIEAGFKEREVGMNEMQLYDKYIDKIIDSKNLEQKFALTEYYSTVTPTDRLRERWIAYHNIVNKKYLEYKTIQEEKESLIKDLTEVINDTTQAEAVENKKENIKQLQQRLDVLDNEFGEDEEYLVQLGVYPGDEAAARTKIKKEFLAKGLSVLFFQNSENQFAIMSEIFYDRVEARDFLNFVKLEKGYKAAFIKKANAYCNSVEYDKYILCENPEEILVP